MPALCEITQRLPDLVTPAPLHPIPRSSPAAPRFSPPSFPSQGNRPACPATPPPLIGDWTLASEDQMQKGAGVAAVGLRSKLAGRSASARSLEQVGCSPKSTPDGPATSSCGIARNPSAESLRHTSTSNQPSKGRSANLRFLMRSAIMRPARVLLNGSGGARPGPTFEVVVEVRGVGFGLRRGARFDHA